MRRNARIVLAAGAVAVVLGILPARAASLPTLLRCSASGTVLTYIGNFEEIVWEDLRSTGRCLGDSKGSYDVTLTGHGYDWGPEGLHLKIRLDLRHTVTGAQRSYNQLWDGLTITCGIRRMVIRNRPTGLPAGIGNIKQCPPRFWEAQYAGASMTWNFLFS